MFVRVENIKYRWNVIDMSGGCRAWTKARDWGSRPEGVRGFKSHPPHFYRSITSSNYCSSARLLNPVPLPCNFLTISPAILSSSTLVTTRTCFKLFLNPQVEHILIFISFLAYKYLPHFLHLNIIYIDLM